MDIYLIWATDGTCFWLVGAWDDDSVTENYDGYLAALAQHRRDYGEDKIRVIKAAMDFDKVPAAFAPAPGGTLTVQED